MTARGTWKASERRIAEKLGGKRVPVTGRERGSAPDVEHKLYAIEHKYGKVLSSRLQTAIEGNTGNITGVLLLIDDFIKISEQKV